MYHAKLQLRAHVEYDSVHQKQLHIKQQGKSEGFESCDQPSNLAQVTSNFSLCDLVWQMTLKKNKK